MAFSLLTQAAVYFISAHSAETKLGSVGAKNDGCTLKCGFEKKMVFV